MHDRRLENYIVAVIKIRATLFLYYFVAWPAHRPLRVAGVANIYTEEVGVNALAKNGVLLTICLIAE